MLNCCQQWNFGRLSAFPKGTFRGWLAYFGLTLIAFVVFGGILGKLSGRRFIKTAKQSAISQTESGVIDDGNLEQFEATCFNEKTDKTFMEGWEAFKGARFDYPSKYVDSDTIKAKYSGKKFKVGLISTAIVLLVFALVFVVYGLVQVKSAGGVDIAVYCVVLALPIILMLSYVFVKPEKKTGAALDQMLEDLDTAVKLQRHVERKVDNSRLYEIENRIRDVIIHEQSKPIPSKKDQLEKQKAQELEMADEDLDDIRDEIFADDNVEEPVAEEPVAEEPAAEVEAPVEKPKKVIPFEPFVKVLDEAIEKGYSKATMRKMANILVLAFGKFQEPAQREPLKTPSENSSSNTKRRLKEKGRRKRNMSRQTQRLSRKPTANGKTPTRNNKDAISPTNRWGFFMRLKRKMSQKYGGFL